MTQPSSPGWAADSGTVEFQMDPRPRAFFPRILQIVFAACALALTAATISLIVFPFQKHQILGLVPVAVGVLLCFMPLAFPAARTQTFLRSPDSAKSWLAKVSALALLVRIPVILLPSPLHSDMLSYYRAALLLSSGAEGAWGRNGLGVFYPPGQSIWLSLWLALLGNHVWVVAVAQLVLTLASLPLLYYAALPSSKISGRIACLIVAVYPALILWSGTGGHETTQIFLLSLLLFLYTRALTGAGWRALACCGLFGLTLGAGTLVRPTFLLLLPLTILTELVFSAQWKRIAAGSLIALLCMTAVIAPWTIRNYREYGRFCLVSAQAGVTLLATLNQGKNIKAPEPDAAGRPVNLVAWDQENMRLAKSTIQNDPLGTFVLGLRNIVWQWGADSSSIDSVTGDPPRGGEVLRKGLQSILNTFWSWFIVSCFLAICLGAFFRHQHSRIQLWSGLLFLLIFLLHTLFEPQARHHLPVLPFLGILFGPAYLHWLGER